MKTYRVITVLDYEPRTLPAAHQHFKSGDTFRYPDREQFPKPLPIEWLIGRGAIEEVQNG